MNGKIGDVFTRKLAKHDGPGPHEGTGTPQSAHGGGEMSGVSLVDKVVASISKDSLFLMRTKETGVTKEKIAEAAEKTRSIIQTAMDKGRIKPYGISHGDDAKISEAIKQGFDKHLNDLAGMHGVHYALTAKDKSAVLLNIRESLGEPKFYPVYPGDDDGVKPVIWADDDPRWATVDQ
jgi:uncharacterized spore protein YtfJ